jgi:hypothetical protein
MIIYLIKQDYLVELFMSSKALLEYEAHESLYREAEVC